MTEILLGNYRLLEKLGQGGMGTVYRAAHRRIPRTVAVKVLLPECSSNAAIVDRFFAEARAAATIQHPSVVEIFDCDLIEGRAYIVMALLEGESLGARIKGATQAGAPIPEDEIIATIQDIARGMAAAHAKGIVHRDLKPDNIFLHVPRPGEKPQVKILDFGIAKLAKETGATQNTTETGLLLGTPPYMSPEQCRGAGKVDRRADVYSLGCILFEMACGRPPFVREGNGELIVAHLIEPPPSAVAFRPTLTAAWDEIIQRLLAKSPDDRLQTMEAVTEALEALRGKLTRPLLVNGPAVTETALSVKAAPLSPVARSVTPLDETEAPFRATRTFVSPPQVSGVAAEARVVAAGPSPQWRLPRLAGIALAVVAVLAATSFWRRVRAPTETLLPAHTATPDMPANVPERKQVAPVPVAAPQRSASLHGQQDETEPVMVPLVMAEPAVPRPPTRATQEATPGNTPAAARVQARASAEATKKTPSPSAKSVGSARPRAPRAVEAAVSPNPSPVSPISPATRPVPPAPARAPKDGGLKFPSAITHL